MLGTSARIGELLAIRLGDLDLDAPIPPEQISGTIVTVKASPPTDRVIPRRLGPCAESRFLGSRSARSKRV